MEPVAATNFDANVWQRLVTSQHARPVPVINGYARAFGAGPVLL